jgi:hypothetical protein
MSDRPPAERVLDQGRVLRALQRGVRRALRQHRLAGNPVAVWRDGRVMWIPSEEIPLLPEDDDA